MSALQDLKEQAVSQLESVGNVYDYLPSPLTPPCIVVTEADPYVTRIGTTLNEYRANFSVVLFVKSGTNAVMSKAMGDLINDSLNALNSPEFEDAWNIGPVERPGIEEINGTKYLATSFEISNTFKGGN